VIGNAVHVMRIATGSEYGATTHLLVRGRRLSGASRVKGFRKQDIETLVALVANFCRSRRWRGCTIHGQERDMHASFSLA
jgi:hypothetical protein